MANKTTAVTKREEEQRALTTLFQDDAGAGFEETTGDDYALPFLTILQPLSPQVDKNDAAYVEGAEPGRYLDTSTNEVLESFDFVPCFYHRAMVEWRDRTVGGGFVAQHPVGHEAKFPREGGVWRTSDETHLADTRRLFGLRLLPDGTATPGVVSFTSTQLKKVRTLLTQLNSHKFSDGPTKGQNLPIFSHLLHFGPTVRQENDKGKWYGFSVKRASAVTDEGLVKAARAARESFASMADVVRPPDADQESAGGDSGGKEVPF